MEKAKVFWSGRSQAVRLPKDYRFGVREVRIRRHANAVILEPVIDNWSWLDEVTGQFDQDAAKAVQEKPKQQKRPGLDRLFK